MNIRLIVALGVTTASPTVAKPPLAPTKIATEAVRNSTLDPLSVQFRKIIVRGALVCGEYNAKNKLGGYVGFKPFSFDVDRNEGYLLPIAHFNRSGIILSAEGINASFREGGQVSNANAAVEGLKSLIAETTAGLTRCAE
jgi:hypothetical protein